MLIYIQLLDQRHWRIKVKRRMRTSVKNMKLGCGSKFSE